MTHILDSLGVWFADCYLLSAVLLLLSLVAARVVRQPVHRLAIVKSTLVALALLAGLCALPGWSVIHPIAAQRQESFPAPQAQPLHTDPVLLKEWIVRTDGDVNAEQPRPMTPAATAEKPAGSHWNLSWLSTLATVQLAGLIGVVAWLSCGCLAVQRLRRTASPAPTELVAVVTEVATARSRVSPKLDPASRRDAATWSSLSETRNQTEIELLISDRIEVPVALGIRRPAILLPYSFANSQSAIPACGGWKFRNKSRDKVDSSSIHCRPPRRFRAA